MIRIKEALTVIFKLVIKSDAFKALTIKILAKLSIKATKIPLWFITSAIECFGPKAIAFMVRKSMLAYDIMEGKFKVRKLKDAEANNDETTWNYISDSL